MFSQTLVRLAKHSRTRRLFAVRASVPEAPEKTRAFSSDQSLESLTITQPDDWHLHLRDGAAMESCVHHSAAQFGRAIIMPNLRPPVVSTGMVYLLSVYYHVWTSGCAYFKNLHED
jgi:hypothetical protein